MSKIIQPDDPMVKAAIKAGQEEQRFQAFVKGMEAQVMSAIFAQLALRHFESGEELTIEKGRKIAEEAVNVMSGYVGFLFEKMGLAVVTKIDTE